MSTTPTPPVRDDMTVLKGSTITQPWQTWLRDLILQVANAPESFAPVVLTGQNATIGSTAVPTPTLPDGRYRVSVNARCEVPAGVSSSLLVSISWSQGGVTQTYTYPTLNGNLTTSVLAAPPLFIHVDAATPVSYAAVYASNPVGAAEFSLEVEIESCR